MFFKPPKLRLKTPRTNIEKTRRKSVSNVESPMENKELGDEQNKPFISIMSPRVVIEKLPPNNNYQCAEFSSEHQSSHSSGEVFKPKQSNATVRDWYLYKRTQREISHIKNLEGQLTCVIRALSQTEHLDTVLLKHKLLQVETISWV